jgi:hypothetical protein
MERAFRQAMEAGILTGSRRRRGIDRIAPAPPGSAGVEKNALQIISGDYNLAKS